MASPLLFVSGAAALLQFVVAVIVFAADRRRVTNLSLAAFLMGNGLADLFIGYRLFGSPAEHLAGEVMMLYVLGPYTMALLVFTAHYPVRTKWATPRWTGVAVLVALTLSASWGASRILAPAHRLDLDTVFAGTSPLTLLISAVFLLQAGAYVVSAYWIARRADSGEPKRLLVAVGIVGYMLPGPGIAVLFAVEHPFQWPINAFGILVVVSALVVGAYVVRRAWIESRPLVLPLASTLVGLLILRFLPATQDSAYIADIVVFTVAVGYAVLSRSVVDLGPRIRWGISQSTIAAIFIAAFFIASEGAQVFFGDVAGSQYMGVMAAGGLVFALAPLQRLASRFAERALPSELDDEGGMVDVYRRQVRLAWRDGRISTEERAMLRELRRSMKLDADVADRIDEEEENAIATRQEDAHDAAAR